MTSESQPVFQVRQLGRTFDLGEVKIQALRGIDLEIYEGEFLVMLGASGSGKSTLLNILGGLDRPTSGDIHFRGHNLSHASDAELTLFRRQHIGFVFQFYNLIPSLTARENVAMVTDIASNPMPAVEALERVGLGQRMDHFPSQLSGGEQQRVAIARAIAKRPDVLLCDEPTGALDSQTGIRVLQVLQDINREFSTTTAIITHNAGIAAMADRMLRLSDGQVSEIQINSDPCRADSLRW